MSFDDKLNTFFANLRLTYSNAPARHLVHLYADYIEVVSLFSNSSYLSISDILDRFKDEGIIKKEKNDDERAKENDENEAWVSGIFNVIMQRQSLYQEDYPFEVIPSSRMRLKEAQHLTDRNRVYIFLLLASCLSQFQIFEPELTTEFEIVCTNVLKNFSPTPAIVKSLGKRSNYTGTAIEKIRSLANDIKIAVDETHLKHISTKGNQERGLDLISWTPFDDNVANRYLVLFQCACGKEWYKKLGETRRYEHYYQFYHSKPTHGMFIPYSLINYQDSDFYQADEITIETVIFERKRILNYLGNPSFFDVLNSKILVDRCIVEEEEIV